MKKNAEKGKYKLCDYYNIGHEVLDLKFNKVGKIIAVTPKTVTVKHNGFKVKYSYKNINEDVFIDITERLSLKQNII